MPCCPHSHSRRCHPWPCLPIASHFFSKFHYWIVHQHVNGLLSPITILCLFFYQNFCWNFQKLKVSRTGCLISGKTPGWPLELVRRENRILGIPQWEEQGWRLWHEFGCVDESSSWSFGPSYVDIQFLPQFPFVGAPERKVPAPTRNLEFCLGRQQQYPTQKQASALSWAQWVWGALVCVFFLPVSLFLLRHTAHYSSSSLK